VYQLQMEDCRALTSPGWAFDGEKLLRPRQNLCLFLEKREVDRHIAWESLGDPVKVLVAKCSSSSSNRVPLKLRFVL